MTGYLYNGKMASLNWKDHYISLQDYKWYMPWNMGAIYGAGIGVEL